MRKISSKIIDLVLLFSGQILSIWILSIFMPELVVNSILSAVILLITYLIAQLLFWWLFVTYFVRMPYFLYPVFTFILNGAFVALFMNLTLNTHIFRITNGIIITISLSISISILTSFLRIRGSFIFDRLITQPITRRNGKMIETEEPGWIYIEIDGLGEEILRKAIISGHLPTLSRWISSNSHVISRWETDYSSQTGSMQAGILLGNNDNIPGYRWWDRTKRKMQLSGDPWVARETEYRLKNDSNLLSEQGASRGNLYTGGAGDSLFTISSVLDNRSASGFYLFLLNPIILAYELTKFGLEFIEEFFDKISQRLRKDKYALPLRYSYFGVFRGFMGPILQDMVSSVAVGDIARGLPDMYIAYSGYDDLSHFAGPESPEAYRMLGKIDQHIARIEHVIQSAPRPYHVVVLSDHGQSQGLTFSRKYGINLHKYIAQLISDSRSIAVMTETEEAWQKISALLSDTANVDSRTARLLKVMLASKTQNGIVSIEKKRKKINQDGEDQEIDDADFILLASGCMGLFYVNNVEQRLTYEEIQNLFPDLIPGLLQHPGIGFLLVKSERDGALVLGEEGINYLDIGYIEGKDPLIGYGLNAAFHARRLSHFSNCPDIVINTVYDAETGEISSLEYQVGHHGGLGGEQNKAFLLAPAQFVIEQEPIVGAEEVNKILRKWQEEEKTQQI